MEGFSLDQCGRRSRADLDRHHFADFEDRRSDNRRFDNRHVVADLFCLLLLA